jgi:hypothetical protein
VNPTRREFLKLLAVAPVAGAVPVASAAAKPLLIGVPHAPLQPVTYLKYSITVRHFVLAVPDKVARNALRQMMDLTDRTNATRYRGFEPGTLRITGWQIEAKDSGKAASIDFDSCTLNEPVEESAEVMELWKRLEMHDRISFAAVPKGKWFELPPSFERRRLVNSWGEVIA